MKKKDLPWLAIECTTEEQYNAIREKLDALGYKPNPSWPSWSDWAERDRNGESHILCKHNVYAIYSHNGSQPEQYTQLTYTDFIEKYSNEPTPSQRIAQLEVEIRDLKERLKKYESQVYEGVFAFDIDGANCMNNGQSLYFDEVYKLWGVGLCKSEITDTHTLTETPTHERGQFYLLHAANPTSPQSYALCMGDWFVGWGNKLPIERKACDVSLMKVVPVKINNQ
jgi:hypothetical protein